MKKRLLALTMVSALAEVLIPVQRQRTMESGSGSGRLRSSVHGAQAAARIPQ